MEGLMGARRPHLPDDASDQAHSDQTRLDRIERRTAKRTAELEAPTVDGRAFASTKWSFGQVATDESDAYTARIASMPSASWPATLKMSDFAAGDFVWPTFLEHQIAVGMGAIEPTLGGDVTPGCFTVPVDGLYRVDVALYLYPGSVLDSWAADAFIRMRQSGFAFQDDPVEVSGPDFAGFTPVWTGEDVRHVFPVSDTPGGSSDLDIGVATSEEVWCAAGAQLNPMFVQTSFRNCSYPAGGGFDLGGHVTVTFLAPWTRT